ncbi:MAG: aldo/keto reductase [Chloroflexi bacterium]|nr:aldo/keto reductase [Chloroflexota bacterium]
MQTLRLGRTNLMVTAVGFGGIPIQRLNEEDAVAVVRHSLDLGINWIDTAHGYTTSEERIGRAIAGRNPRPILCTKSHGLTAEAYAQEVEQSFQRLGVNYIDVYQFHGVSKAEQFDKITAPNGPLDVARRLRDEGRIGHIGVTSHNLDVAIELVQSDLFETLMFPFNFITREPAERLIPLCRQHDVGFIAMKPMGGGLLEDATLAFKWLRRFPDVVPLVGIQALAEIDEIMRIMEGPAELSAEEEARIEAIRQELGTRFCRSCDYCQPCSVGIHISSVMRLRSAAKRFPAERFYGQQTQQMVALVEECIDCGKCEERCPYELEIRQTLRENAEWYKEQIALHQSGRA